MILERTVNFVKKALVDAEGGHDWFHTERVWKNTLMILETEEADPMICQLAALLHDIADSKFHNGDETLGPGIAGAFLEKENVSPFVITEVKNIIFNMSYKASLGKRHYHSKEMEIVQDADRLDAIGAIGIARAFSYGGYKNRKIYDPDILVVTYDSKEAYKSTSSPTIQHFYEKLLLLKDKMNTDTAKRIAEHRHLFMEQFLEEFYAEWHGEK